MLLAACSSERGSGRPAGGEAGEGGRAAFADTEVRTYIEQRLRPYVTIVAKTACSFRATATPKWGRYGVCLPASQSGGKDVETLTDPKAETVWRPPKDGKPFPSPDTAHAGKDTVDNEVSAYLENRLRPYLGSLATILCASAAKTASRSPGYGLCQRNGKPAEKVTMPEGETVTVPPKNRQPYPPPVQVPVAVDVEVRHYIETQLRPYLTSLAKVVCGARAAAAPAVDRQKVCVPYRAGVTDVVALEDGPASEGVTMPPKDGRPYPGPDSTPPPRP
jgi:hypothetical protein